MRRIGPLLVLLLALASLSSAARATADTGVSIDIGRIEITDELTPGGGYQLPTIGVRNPGTERTKYRLTVSYTQEQQAKRPPSEWFRFAPAELTLDPGQSRPVQVKLTLPTGADPGDYEALVGPQIVSEQPGASVSAAAAARVSFTVEPANLLEAWWLKLKRFFSGNSPWTWLVPLLLVGVLAVWQLRRRFTLSIGRRV